MGEPCTLWICSIGDPEFSRMTYLINIEAIQDGVTFRMGWVDF